MASRNSATSSERAQGLDTLHVEVVSQILSHLVSPIDLANACTVRPRFYQLAEPAFVRALQLYAFTDIDSCRNFLRFILQYPRLRKFVTSLDLERCGRYEGSRWGGDPPDWWKSYTNGPPIQPRDLEAILNLDYCPPEAHDLIPMLEIESGSPRPRPYHESDNPRFLHQLLSPILLMLLPCVQHLHTTNDLSESFAAPFGRLMEHMHQDRVIQQETPSFLSGFMNLRRVSCFYDQRDNGEAAYDLAEVAPFLHLPRLLQLDGHNVVAADDEEQTEQDNSFESPPYAYGLRHTEPGSSSLESLVLCNSIIPLTQLALLLHIPSALKLFHYHYGDSMVKVDNMDWSVDQVFVASRLKSCLPQTLETLSLDAEPFSFGHISAVDLPESGEPEQYPGFDTATPACPDAIGSLRDFVNLRRLGLPLTLLLGPPSRQVSGNLADLLPPSLNRLDIYHTHWRTYENYHYGEAVPRLVEMIESRSLDLQLFSLGFSEQDSCTQLEELGQAAFLEVQPVFKPLQVACDDAGVEFRLRKYVTQDVNREFVQGLAKAHV